VISTTAPLLLVQCLHHSQAAMTHRQRNHFYFNATEHQKQSHVKSKYP